MTDYLTQDQRELYDDRMKNIYKEFGDWVTDQFTVRFAPPIDEGTQNLMRMSWQVSQRRQELIISQQAQRISELELQLRGERELNKEKK